MGDLGPPIQLPSAAEVILRNVDAVNQIGEGAVRAGGFKRFLEEAEDAGADLPASWIGSSRNDHVVFPVTI